MRALIIALALAAASPAFADQTSLTLADVANSARPISWKTGQTEIWRWGINTRDTLIGLYAYSPTDGHFVGAPFQFDSAAQTISRTWMEGAQVINSSPSNSIVGSLENYTNSGGNPSQGRKLFYVSNAGSGGVGGSDIAETRIYVDRSTTFPADPASVISTGDWLVAISPNASGASARWGLTGEELDVVNRGADNGLRLTRNGVANPVTGFMAIPEAATFGEGGTTENGDWAFWASASGGNNQGGVRNKWYAPIGCDKDSLVAGSGRCFVTNGTDPSTPAARPYGPFSAHLAYLHGIDLTDATFADNVAVRAPAGAAFAVATAVGLNTSVTIGGCKLDFTGGLLTGKTGC